MKIADNVRIGTASGDYSGTVRLEIRIYPDGTLSIMGEVGPPSDPYAAGQVKNALTSMARYAPGWNAAKVNRLFQIWNEWHLECPPDSIVTELREMFG